MLWNDALNHLSYLARVVEDTVLPAHSTANHTLETKFLTALLALNIVIQKLFYIPNYIVGNSLTWVFKQESLISRDL